MKKLIIFGAMALTMGMFIYSCEKEEINESSEAQLKKQSNDLSLNQEDDNFEAKAGGPGITIKFENGRRFGTLKDTDQECECGGPCFGICQITDIKIGFSVGDIGNNGNGNGNGNGIITSQDKLSDITLPSGAKYGVLRRINREAVKNVDRYIFYVPKSNENIMEDNLYLDEDIIFESSLDGSAMKFHKGVYPVEKKSGTLRVGKDLYDYIGIVELEIEDL